jgi:hypothetical protein
VQASGKIKLLNRAAHIPGIIRMGREQVIHAAVAVVDGASARYTGLVELRRFMACAAAHELAEKFSGARSESRLKGY